MKKQKLGDIAFSDPTELVGKTAQQRAQARERWKEKGSDARKNKSNEKANFHLKHG